MRNKLLCLLVALCLCAGCAWAEGLLTEEAEIISEAVELAVPEAEEALSGDAAEDAGGDGFTGGQAVSAAAGDVKIDAANFPDKVFRSYVKRRFGGGDGVLSAKERAAVTEIEVDGEEIADLTGIEWFANLRMLDCSDTRLTRLDLSRNTALEEVFCSGCGLESLNLGTKTAMTKLICERNKLTSLDVSDYHALTRLKCSDNRLTSLKLGKNTALTYLDCSENQLTRLDVSGCPMLKHLVCYENKLTCLNVKGFSALEEFCCDDNRVTRLDVSGCAALTWLDCCGNSMTSLNVNGCTVLERLNADHNKLSAIGLRGCPVLIAASRKTPDKASGVDQYDYYTGDGYAHYRITVDQATRLIADGASLDSAVISLERKTCTYTGKALKPGVTVTLDGKTLVEGTDYKVAYRNNRAIGKATVTVKGVGNYTGTKKAAFSIVPKKVTGLKLKAGRKELTVTWKKAGGVTGYQVQYGTKSDFSNAEKQGVEGAATVSATLKDLKANRTYYVRVRAYKIVDGKRYRSDWSSYKKIRVK